MATVIQTAFVGVEDYLEGERTSTTKHEYVAGRVYAMVGTSKTHNRIALNITTALDRHLRGGPCQVFMADLKVHVEAAEAFYYPDVVVSCDPTDNDPYLISRPCLIIEVSSPSTERIDQGEKLYNYRRLDSLQEYVLVSTARKDVQIYRRDNDDWRIETCGEGEVHLASVNLRLAVEGIFAGVLDGSVNRP